MGRRLTRLHADTAIHADTFTVGVVVFRDVLRQVRDLIRPTQTPRVKDLCLQGFVRLLGERVEQRRVNQARYDGVNPDAQAGQVPGAKVDAVPDWMNRSGGNRGSESEHNLYT